MQPLNINGKNTNYFIDEQGKIFNKKLKELKGSIKNGYKSVKLTINGEKKDYLVHRLVAETFLDNPMDFKEVNHINLNKLDNSVNNLEWISRSDNMKHVFEKTKICRQKQWKITEDIKDWKQYKNTNYYVSKDGRVANVKTQKYLNAVEQPNGYLRYYLYISNQRCLKLAHRLVYEVYNNYELKSTDVINHIDGNKHNNNIENLECISQSNNMIHSYYTLKQNIKKVEQYDLCLNKIADYPSLSEAARKNGYNVAGISQAANGKIKTYKNYIWKII